jgi:hypothetical protein
MFVFVILIFGGFSSHFQISKELQVGSISQSTMSWLKKKKHLNVDVQKRGFAFAKCIVCESLKDLISKVRKNNLCVKNMKLN